MEVSLKEQVITKHGEGIRQYLVPLSFAFVAAGHGRTSEDFYRDLLNIGNEHTN